MGDGADGRPPAGDAKPAPSSSPAARAFDRFVQPHVTSSRLLVFASVLALLWANSPWAAGYHALWNAELPIRFGAWSLHGSVRHWVNDGLMALFFLLVGLELKREILVGELRSPKRSALPIVAAIGGMIVPASIYALFNAGHPGAAGWGIPMATDIAFALAACAAVGDRAPLSLKVFLTALAIVDDLGAVAVIAFIYTSDVSWSALGVALALVTSLAVINVAGVRRLAPYAVVGVFLRLGMLQSGVHAALAGVLLAMTIPARGRIGDVAGVSATAAATGARLEPPLAAPNANSIGDGQQAGIDEDGSSGQTAQSPLLDLERRLGGIVAYAVVPLFALANAGLTFGGGAGPRLDRVSLGVLLGLLLGKQVGIMLAARLAVRVGVASLPPGISWKQLHGVAVLGGIGLTMSLFVAELAFGDPAMLASAKLGIFAGSMASLALGILLLTRTGRGSRSSADGPGDAAQSMPRFVPDRT